MICPDCGNEMEQVDSTYSNYNSGRVNKGELFECMYCELCWIDDFLNNILRIW